MKSNNKASRRSFSKRYADGFHFLELPARSGETKSLIVILHGHNNHPDMFRPMAFAMQHRFPDTDVLLVQGPYPLNASPDAKVRKNVPDVDDLYTWHRLEKRVKPHVGLVVGQMFNRVAIIGQLNRFIDARLIERELGDERLALFGFSMGGAVAVQAAARRPKKCAAVVCHSGLVLPNLRAKSKPDTLLVMGDEDPLFYKRRMALTLPQKDGRLHRAFQKAASRVTLHHEDTVNRLRKAGIPFEQEIIEGLTHSINGASLRKSLAFIAGRLR